MGTTTGGIEHLAVDGIVSLSDCKSLGCAPGFLAGAAQVQKEQEDGGGEREPGERTPPQRGEDGDHRRPRFQSSSRA